MSTTRNISLEITVQPNPRKPTDPVTLGRDVSLTKLPRVGERIVFNSGFGATVADVAHLEHTGNPYLTLKTQLIRKSEFKETLQKLQDDGWIIV